MHDALLARIHVVELDAEISAVLAQSGDLLCGDLIDDVKAAFDGGWHVVVDSCDGAIGAAHFAASKAKAFECLGGSDLVHQLKVDVDEGGLALGLDHNVLLPYLFE